MFIFKPNRSPWMEGLLWAESLYRSLSADSARNLVNSYTYGNNDEFDKGARAYQQHWSTQLTYKGVVQLTRKGVA